MASLTGSSSLLRKYTYRRFFVLAVNSAGRALSRRAFSRLHGSGARAAGLRHTRALCGRSSRPVSSAWLNVPQEPEFRGQPEAERLPVLSVRIGREPPGPLRSCDSPEPPCRCGGPVPARRLCCPLAQAQISGTFPLAQLQISTDGQLQLARSHAAKVALFFAATDTPEGLSRRHHVRPGRSSRYGGPWGIAA